MSEKGCCGTCKFSRYDEINGYLCVNFDSDNCTDFVDYDSVCEEWTEKG